MADQHADRTPLERIADAVNELTTPQSHVEWFQRFDERTRKHLTPEKHETSHPSLLEQLRAASTASKGGDTAPTSGYESRPTARIEAVDRLAAVEQAVDDWLVRVIEQPTRLTLEDNLRALVGASPGLDTRQLSALARETARWLTWARVVTGWDTPPQRPNAACPLCEARGDLRVRLEEKTAACLACGETWDPATFGLLADHIRGLNAGVASEKQQISDLAAAIDDYFPYRGPCLAAGCYTDRHDARHRQIDELVGLVRSGQPPTWVAEAHQLPVDAVLVAVAWTTSPETATA